MAKNIHQLVIPMAHMGQAVSDGELNMSARGSAGSRSSLPGLQAGQATNSRVLSWAVSFEKLLEDPTGVRYFTDFLNSEVSGENIMFWQACEEFKKIPETSPEKLRESAASIYTTYLADSALYGVNIDDTARSQTQDLERPTADMFDKAQSQIFMLMKMDSYRRFVRSPLYQSCSLASVEGRPLPSHPSSEPGDITGSWEEVVSRSPSFCSNGKQDKKAHGSPGKLRHKRGSLGAADMLAATGTHMTVKSTSSVELGTLYRQTERQSSPGSPDQAGLGGGGRRLPVEGGYCCVFLPDGSASLAPTRPGLSLRDMLAGLCEKRGFPLKDVIIYLRGKDRPLSMEQDCSVLRDQQVTLELRVMLRLEVVSTGKTMGIMVKSSKTLQDALSVVLLKHQLKPQDTMVTMAGSSEPLDMCTSVYKLANKKLILHSVKDKDQSPGSRGSVGTTVTTQGRTVSPEGADDQSNPQLDRNQPRPSKNRDIEALLEMLSRAQCSRVDDQRGLLTKEHLQLPTFLLLPPPAEQQQQQRPPVGKDVDEVVVVEEVVVVMVDTDTTTTSANDAAAQPSGKEESPSQAQETSTASTATQESQSLKETLL